MNIDYATERLLQICQLVYTDYTRGSLEKLVFGTGAVPIVRLTDCFDETGSNVRDWTTVRGRETVTLETPPCIGPMPTTITEKIGTHRRESITIHRIQDVQLVGPDALPITSNGSILLEGVEGSSARALDAHIRAIADRTVPIRRTASSEYDCGVSLAGPWSDQFFHWFVEYLPRLLVVMEYADEHGLSIIYFVPSDAPNWLLQSLELFGVSDDQLVPWSGGRANVHNLLLPSLWRLTADKDSTEGYTHSPRGIHEVADRLRTAVDEQSARPEVGPRLFVSRSGAATRNVLNETALQPVFDDYGFDVVQPETWPVDEQIATFARADVIAGPHGGGLTNAMYASEPTVIELFGENTNACYFSLFAGSGWEYGLLNGDAVGSDLRVDPNDFRQLCERMLDQSSSSSSK